MLQVQVNDAEAKQIYLDAIGKKLEEFDASFVYWDSNELKRRTCMSWNSIQDNFFHDKDFPKAKVGGKWYYPAKEVEAFLRKWILERVN
ncbi:DNA-binding protein [Lysinibacillus sphaericus]|uniref:DNA-binding protein n=1 Tax=Lysinibacillus sphaericus TaxID=1421 RepID=A0A544U8D6_LYSSH|nr:helix-turn-helix domain-containing protein [Lysinibacillus sp. SDF0037]TQR28359.1 DNA-binding protein [Lysinibacillus sp. SDF0037]